MEALGFSQDDMEMILQLERERIQKGDRVMGYGRPNRMGRAAFPSNPKEGDWHYNTFDIHLSTIEITAAGIAGALVRGGVGAAIAVVAANAMLNELIADSGYTAIKVTMRFRCGITHHGCPVWRCGPVTWKLV